LARGGISGALQSELITFRLLLIISQVKIWISKNSEVPVSEQLAAQITLGIAAGDLRPGEKLPSTREIARRCEVHANTVGAVYRRLADQNLLEFRLGSGFYVTESAGKRLEGARRLDELIETFLESAGALGFSEDEVRKRLTRPRVQKPADRVVLIESDDGLRDILIDELKAESLPVSGATFDELASGSVRKTSLLAAMFDEKPKVEAVLNDGQRCVYLKGRSVSAAMAGETRPAENDLIAVVSGWSGFLTFARIMLLAAKIDPGNLVVRSRNDDDWERAIKAASMIVCDSLTAKLLKRRNGVRAFRVISDESLNELRSALASEPAS
jgi:GntR family transcriptional regulator